MPTQCYHDGDFWLCKSATAAGQSPTTTPAKWTKQEIPAAFRRYLVTASVAKILPGEGKTDLARAVVKEAEAIGLELVARHSATEGNDVEAQSDVKMR